MRTKDFCEAIEHGFDQAYDNSAGFTTVPYIDEGEIKHCLGLLLAKGEHFAVVVAHAAHWIVQDPDAIFSGTMDEHSESLDRLEDFYNLVSGMRTAPYMHWTCVFFPTLTEGQVDAETIDEPLTANDNLEN